MAIEIINPRDAVRPAYYSQAVRVDDTVYVSGQVAWDRKGVVVGKGDIAAQVEQVFQNLADVLKLAGGGLENVVKLTAFLTNPLFYRAFREARVKRYPGDAPASTALIVPALASPELLVEVEAIASLSRNRRYLNQPGRPLEQRRNFSQAAQTGDVVYVSGHAAVDREEKGVGRGDVVAQAEAIFRGISDDLAMAGAGLRNIALLKNFLINPALFPPFWEAHNRIIPSNYPANNVIVVGALASPDFLAETEAIASASGDVELIEPPWEGKPVGYTMAARIGKTLYISGQLARDRNGIVIGRGDIKAQAEQALLNMGIVLRRAGVEYRDVVKITTYLTNATFFPAWREVRTRFFPSSPPASTTVAVQGLTRADFLIEVEAVAVLH
ncbi:MAG: hypothetical protein HYU29_04810 [Chloroflexi bacterium]|nr:hypothetical protein [Chloroflexota bacterium]